MISLICCYNRRDEFEKMEITLYMQKAEFELIGIDNTNGEYKSAAEALNAGGQMAKGEILVFLHQDIRFKTEDGLTTFVKPLSIEKRHLIVGLYAATHRQHGYLRKEYKIVETVDECCIGMRRETWQQYRFNEVLCNGWHLYSVELCIRVRRDGGLIVCGNFPIEHLSIGNVDKNYMRTFKKLLVQYKSENFIATTAIKMPTCLLYYYCYYFPWAVKKLLFGNYPIRYIIRNLFKANEAIR